MIENQVISYVLANKDWNFIIENDIDETYFTTNVEQFKYLQRYHTQYDQVPDTTTFLGTFPEFDYLEVSESTKYLAEKIKSDRNFNYAATTYNDIRKVLANEKLDDQMKTDRIASLTLQLNNLISAGQSIRYSSMEDLTELAINTFNERETNKSKHYYNIGIRWLDDIFNGWDKDNDYVIVAGRPGTGKSMLLCKLAAEQLKAGKRVAFYEGEMSTNQTYERIVAACTGISTTSMLKADQSIKGRYFNILKDYMLGLPGRINILTPQDLGSKYPTTYQLETFVRKTNADILFIDQLSLMNDLEHAKVPFEKAGNISRQIKGMRDKLNIPVICASQMNRTQNDGNKVDNNQIAGSDMIAQDATRIIMLTSKRDEDDNTITFTISKNRSGKSYAVQDFAVDFAKCYFEEVVEADSEQYANNQSLFMTAPGGC